jgi:hypothetical protein
MVFRLSLSHLISTSFQHSSDNFASSIYSVARKSRLPILDYVSVTRYRRKRSALMRTCDARPVKASQGTAVQSPDHRTVFDPTSSARTNFVLVLHLRLRHSFALECLP